jgi:hypothetical protein
MRFSEYEYPVPRLKIVSLISFAVAATMRIFMMH